MATRTVPSTPATITAPTIVSDSPTGNWRHPKFDEVNKRLQASSFGERNVKQILWRLLALVALLLAKQVNSAIRWLVRLDIARSVQAQLPPFVQLFLTTLLPLCLFAYALLPLRSLFMQADEISDIALTPQQRVLLGLKPSSQPATPGSQVVTPPRYSRSATPRSGSSSASGSPFSGKGSPLGSGFGQSGYSPNASPLFQKAVGRDGPRRLSYGSPSPLGMGRTINDSNSSLASQISNSPSAGKGASVSLNNRWLYERGRRSSSGLRSVYS